MTQYDEKSCQRRVAMWRENPERSLTAVLGLRMIDGEWVGPSALEEEGANKSGFTPIIKTLRGAGYALEDRVPEAGPGNAREYRVAASKARRTTVRNEQRGVTHPEVGSMLRVRAVIAEDDGRLLVHLTNGTGAWTVQIMAQVGS